MANTPMPENISSEAEAAMVVLDMCTSWIYSAALHTIVQLDVPNILATHATAPNMAMTAEELLWHMVSCIPLEIFVELSFGQCALELLSSEPL